MRTHWSFKAIKIALFVALFITLAGFVVMQLWNWLTPALFGWHTITFWQALGILVLSKLLFGGFRGGRPGWRSHWRNRMMERWEQMTPGEREKFREGMRRGCSSFGPASAEPKA
jgi:hypothetical protein